MDIHYEAMAAQARDTLDALRTGLQHRTNEIRTTWSRAALAAIRDARARLGRWEPIVAAWAKSDADAADAREAQGAAAQSPPTDPSAAPPPVAARRPEHANGQSSAAAAC